MSDTLMDDPDLLNSEEGKNEDVLEVTRRNMGMVHDKFDIARPIKTESDLIGPKI